MGTLLANGIIHSAVFGLRFSEKTDRLSKITIGDYDRDLVGGNKIYWEKNIGTDRWKIAMKSLVYGVEKIPLNNGTWISITTGEKHLRLYRDIFDNIAKILRSKKECFYKTSEPLFSCIVEKRDLDQFEVIEIHLNNVIIYIEPSEYILFVLPLITL